MFVSAAFAQSEFNNYIPDYSEHSTDEKISKINELLNSNKEFRDDEIISLYEEIIRLSEESDDERVLKVGLKSLAEFKFKLAMYTEAMFNYERLIALLSEDEKKEKALLELKVGECLKFSGLYERAVQHFIAALNISNENNFEEIKSSVLVNLGHVNLISGNYNKALEYFEESLEIKEKYNVVLTTPHVLKNIGNVYVHLKDYQAAEKYYYSSLKLFEDISDSTGISAVMNNLGFLEEEQGNLSNALKYFEKSKAIASAIGDQYLLQHNFYNIANIYYKMERYDDSKSIILGNLLLTSEKRNLEIYLKNKILLAKVAIAQNKLRDAIRLYDEYIIEKDSLLNAMTNKHIASLLISYDNEKLQLEVKDLKSKTESLSRSLWIVILLSVFIIGIMLTSKYIKRPF